MARGRMARGGMARGRYGSWLCGSRRCRIGALPYDCNNLSQGTLELIHVSKEEEFYERN